MSESSATTLISSSATGPSNRSGQAPHPPGQRRQSSHSSHSHHPKRRASQHHAHGHGHGHHTAHRRPSEGDHGRRAMAAGLAMQVLEGAVEARPKRSGSNERPLPKSSRSDTHLPRLSRTTSITSETSHSSDPKRPKAKGRKRSGESVEVIEGDGKEPGEPVDPDEDGWESGEEEVKEDKPKSKGKAKSSDTEATAAAMRRTVSDTQAEVPAKASDAKVITDSDLTRDHHPTRRTTGFAGTIHTPAPDSALEVQAMKNISTPHYNDPTHVMPAHQVRHQASSRTLSTISADQGAMSAIDGDKTPKPGSVARSGSGHGPKRQESLRPEVQKLRSTDGSGMPQPDQQRGAVDTSPSFPFPKMQMRSSPEAMENALPTPPASTESAVQPNRADTHGKPGEGRTRLASGAEPRLRHRYSNSSIRSIQSLRAPPHPLNSPTGGKRSGLPTTSTSRAGSTFNSPQKARGPNLHQPPIAAPVVYREVAKGEGWDIPEEEGSSASRPLPTAHGSNGKDDRKSSFSSQRSLQGLLGNNAGKNRASSQPLSASTYQQPHQPSKPSRRRTAVEVASAAAKMSTTNDPVEYHHSLGYPASSAETAHLISRFLPHKRPEPLSWDLTAESAADQNGIGLSRGAYRDAHESLIWTMKNTSVASGPGRRAPSRAASYHALLAPSTGPSSSEEGSQVGTTRGRNGTLAVAKGGWQGRTPFEMSVDRCLAQRPQQRIAGVNGM